MDLVRAGVGRKRSGVHGRWRYPEKMLCSAADRTEMVPPTLEFW
jgi:hypothetical protein